MNAGQGVEAGFGGGAQQPVQPAAGCAGRSVPESACQHDRPRAFRCCTPVPGSNEGAVALLVCGQTH